jgi:porin
LNSAFGTGTDFSQSGAGGPSIFPRTALALRFDGKPDPDIVVRGALLNGVPFVRPDGSHALFRSGDGVLGVVEVAFLSRPGSRSDAGTRTTDRIGRFSALPQYADKLALGAWRYSGSYADLSDVNSSGAPLMHRGSSGLYALLDRTIVDGGKPGQPRVSAFLQGGIADSLTNRFDSRLGAGIVGSGLPWLHDSDQAGGAVTQVRNGSHYLRSLPPTQATQRTETTFEATYLTQALKALALQPDLQYIIRPNADPSRARAWVVQMRFEISY